MNICGALHDLVPFAQFKKPEKHPWRSKINTRAWVFFTSNFTKINTPPWVFFMFFKLYKWYQIAQCTTYTPSIIYSFKIKSCHRKMCETCSNVTIKTTKQHCECCSYLSLMTLNEYYILFWWFFQKV